MDRNKFQIPYRGLTGFCLLFASLYLFFVVRLDFYFHHVQPGFLWSKAFFAAHFTSPGAFSQWFSLLIMQSFYSRIFGTVVFLGLAILSWGLSLILLDRIRKDRFNKLMALIPVCMGICLLNNYNFPLSVFISQILLLLLFLVMPGRGEHLYKKLIFFTAGALFTWYVSGSGFLLLFSVLSLFLLYKGGSIKSLLPLVWVSAISILIPLLSGDFYFWYFPEKIYFLAYEASAIFYLYLLSLPLLLALGLLPRISIRPGRAFGLFAILFAAILVAAHSGTFRSDAKKIVASDYYCYHLDAGRVKKAARSLENYSFSANLNYNLAISREGRLSSDIFKFFQISGSDGLFPDVDFSPEMLFISADFYYDLGYISAARHYAYEALVFYPYSPRALQLLVKVHLVCGEYTAADRCLKILDQGLVSRRFIKAYKPYVEDPLLVQGNQELAEKRRFIPAEDELSLSMDRRLKDLLEANPENLLACEFLMLYYLLDGQLEPFVELYEEMKISFSEPVAVYEEALMMYGIMTFSQDISEMQVSKQTRERYEKFARLAKQYEGDLRMARSVLYREMGQTYMYYLGYLYPRIVKPARADQEYDEAPI